MYTKEEVAIVEWVRLPKDIAGKIAEKYEWKFQNDIMLELHSENGSWDPASWKSWYEEKKEEGETFEGFLEDVNDTVEYELAVLLGFDENTPKKVILDICW